MIADCTHKAAICPGNGVSSSASARAARFYDRLLRIDPNFDQTIRNIRLSRFCRGVNLIVFVFSARDHFLRPFGDPAARAIVNLARGN